MNGFYHMHGIQTGFASIFINKKIAIKTPSYIAYSLKTINFDNNKIFQISLLFTLIYLHCN